MSLSKLNHDCFLSVLGALPLYKQFTFRLVSTNWCSALELAMRHRRTLVLREARHTSPRTNYYSPVYTSNGQQYFRSFTFNGRHFCWSSSYNLENTLFVTFFPIDHPAYKLGILHLCRLLPAVRRLFSFKLYGFVINPYLKCISPHLTTLAIRSPFFIDWPLLQAPHSPLAHLYLQGCCLYLGNFEGILGQLKTFAAGQMSFRHLSHFGASIRSITSRLGQYDLRYRTVSCPAQGNRQHLSIVYIGNFDGRTEEKWNKYLEQNNILENILSSFSPNVQSLHVFDPSISPRALPLIARKLKQMCNLTELTIDKVAYDRAVECGFPISAWAQGRAIQLRIDDKA